MCENAKCWLVAPGSQGPKPVKMQLPGINKENLQGALNTGESVVDEGLLCACLYVSAHTRMCISQHIYTNALIHLIYAGIKAFSFISVD